MATVNLASKFSKYIDEAFKRETILGGATNDKIDFTGVNEVSVYTVDPMKLNDYTRTGTNRFGALEEIGDSVQTFQITQDKSFTGTIDAGNAADQMNIKGASARLRTQIRDVVGPEIEKYTLNKWAYGAGKVVGSAAPAADTILGKIQTGASYMNNAHVPKAGRTMFIKETYAAMLPNLSQLAYLQGLGTAAITENKLPKVAGFEVRPVPDTDMPANVFFILQHKEACPLAKKLEYFAIHNNPPGINGNVIEGRFRYWSDVLGNKSSGVYVLAATDNVQAAPTIAISANKATVTAAGATIYYTTDGTDPRYSKTRQLIASGGDVTLTAGQLIRAYAYTSAKYPSAIAAATNE